MSAVIRGTEEGGAGDAEGSGVRGVCTLETGALAGTVRGSTRVGGTDAEV